MSKRTFRPPQTNPIDPLPGGWTPAYKSYQKIINSNNGQVDPDKLQEHLEMMANDPSHDWEQIEPIDFSELNKGDRIRYVTKTPKNEILFRTGGWVTAIDEDNFEWLAYMAHTKSSWTLQAEDCVKLWVTRKKEKFKGNMKIVKDENIIYFNPIKYITNFPVYLKSIHKNGTDEVDENVMEVVYYAKDNYDKKRFEATNKYLNALNNTWDFK